jgi:hypothetical protein
MPSGHVRQAFRAGQLSGRQGRASMSEEAVMQSGNIRQEGKEDRAGRNARKAQQAVRQA